MSNDDYWREFHERGEESVRQELAAGQYGEKRKRAAEAWLAHQESSREEFNRASALVETREANALAREANDIARSARDASLSAIAEARTSNSLARDSNAIAREASASARQANKIAIAALIAAIVAIAIQTISMLP